MTFVSRTTAPGPGCLDVEDDNVDGYDQLRYREGDPFALLGSDHPRTGGYVDKNHAYFVRPLRDRVVQMSIKSLPKGV